MAAKHLTHYTTKFGNEVDKVQIKGRIPVPLAMAVKTLLLDPKTGMTEYGGLSALLTHLLSEWVDGVRLQQNQE